MKYLSLVFTLLFVGLIVGCAPAVSQASRKVAPNGSGPNLEPTLAEPGDTPTSPVTPTATSTPTIRPPPVPTSPATPTPVTLSPTLVKLTDTPTPSPTPTSPPATATPIPTSASIEPAAGSTVDGLQLYQVQNCGNCHQLDASGAQGTVGPTHNGIATTAEARIQAADYTGAATTPAGYIRESIVNPGVYLVAGYDLPRLKMPAYTNLSEAEVEALVQFLLSQK
jgi:mono/diheme cytochrome c family protein